MQPKFLERLPSARGRMRALFVPNTQITHQCGCKNQYGLQIKSHWNNNLVLRQWSGIAAQLLAYGKINYRVSGMYLEFANVNDIDVPVPIPEYDRNPASAVQYYDSLADSDTNDYLRVPMIAAIITSEDSNLYPDGNLIAFFAQSSGVAGVHGKPFGSDSNSVVIGAALIAQVSESDATQDLVLSRAYFDADEQQPKLATGQVGIDWELALQ